MIISVHNGEKYLAEAIESALAQTYSPVEIVLVDDGSTDRSAEIARSYKEVLYVHQPHRGLAEARNRGLDSSRGELIAFLDADDIWTPEKLALQAEYLSSNPDVGFVVCLIKNFLDPGLTLPEGVSSHPLEREQVNLPAMLARRKVFDKVGGFDPSYRFGSDLDWVVRAKDLGVSMAILPKQLMHRRIHEGNMSHHLKARKKSLLRTVKASIDRRGEEGPSR